MKLEKIKKKSIENMTDKELIYIIENDSSLVAFERIDYIGELLRRTIKKNGFIQIN